MYVLKRWCLKFKVYAREALRGVDANAHWFPNFEFRGGVRRDRPLFISLSLAMATRTVISSFDTKDLCQLLSQKIAVIGSDTVSKFRSENITGSAFLDLNEEDLRELVTLGERKAIQKLIKEYEPRVSTKL